MLKAIQIKFNRKMTYSGELVMPTRYVEVDEDEMMYLDGGGLGKHWYNKNGVVSAAIDIAVCLIPAVCSLNAFMKAKKLASLGRTYIRTAITQAVRKAGISLAASTANAILNTLFAVCATSRGGAIVWCINRIDGKPNDGYCFA